MLNKRLKEIRIKFLEFRILIIKLKVVFEPGHNFESIINIFLITFTSIDCFNKAIFSY